MPDAGSERNVQTLTHKSSVNTRRTHTMPDGTARVARWARPLTARGSKAIRGGGPLGTARATKRACPLAERGGDAEIDHAAGTTHVARRPGRLAARVGKA